MRVIYANGEVHVVILDAADEDYEVSQVGICADTCPKCDGTIRENQNYCPQCQTDIIWLNSKIWKSRFGLASKRVVDELERTVASHLEKVAIEVLQSITQGYKIGTLPKNKIFTIWPDGTLTNLRTLRSIPIPDRREVLKKKYIRWLEGVCISAYNKIGTYNSKTVNYLLGSILHDLGETDRLQAKGRHIKEAVSLIQPEDEVYFKDGGL